MAISNGTSKPQIIGLGLNGLIGSRVTELLSDKYDFIPLSRSNGVDITDPESLTRLKKYTHANFVLNLAAKADVDGCEKDKDLGKEGEAWKINAQGAGNVAEICRELGKKLIHISTDFVFDGELEVGKSYTEQDLPSPINWYAQTKFEGEKAVEAVGADYVIARIAYPYRAQFESKNDFVRAILDRLNQGVEVKAVTDHYFCPTFIDDIAFGLDKLIETDSIGIYHLVGLDALTPYEAAIKIAETFNLDKDLIIKTNREEFFQGRAPRPFNLSLSNAKIKELGANFSGFSKGLQTMKSQLQ